MDFDEVIDRRGTHSSKWDTMEELYGVSPDNGISMWVATHIEIPLSGDTP